MSLAERLIEFAEAGNQQKIILANGDVLQGWIMEITDDALLISTGYSEKIGKDHWIQLDQLPTLTLSYWDNKKDIWQEFKL